MAGTGIFVVGVFLLVIALIGYVIPIDEGYSIPQVVGLCNSGMGELGQAFSGEIVKGCSEFNGLLMGVYGAGILGVVLMIVGAVRTGKKKEDYEKEVEDDAIDILEKRYAKGELSKEEFDKMKKDLE